MSDFAIEATHLHKEFNSIIAVDDLTIQVNSGEVFGFLGPNGAGKTTSIKMLLGLIFPTSGQASLLGKPIGNRELRRQIGYLPEHFRFYPWQTGNEFLLLHGRLYGQEPSRCKENIPGLLERVGLEGRGDTKLGAYSKGMTQRIGLAQALMNDPKLVILDEPTSGLDPIGRKLVRDIIHDLREAGTTVFVNSHLLGEIEKTCDRAAFIRSGSIVEVHKLDEMDNDIRVQIRVGASDEALLTLMATFGRDVRHEQNTLSLTLPDESKIPQLVAKIIESGHDVYAVTPERVSLEDRFIRIVGKSEG